MASRTISSWKRVPKRERSWRQASGERLSSRNSPWNTLRWKHRRWSTGIPRVLIPLPDWAELTEPPKAKPASIRLFNFSLAGGLTTQLFPHDHSTSRQSIVNQTNSMKTGKSEALAKLSKDNRFFCNIFTKAQGLPGLIPSHAKLPLFTVLQRPTQP